MPIRRLSEVRPEFEQIKAQLETELGLRSEVWNDQITAAIGQFIIEAVAAIGAFDQLSIERAAQETMLDTARLTSSVITIMRMLGVHVSRRSPASVQARVSNLSNNFTRIPKYSTFSVGGSDFFNRTDILFNVDDGEKNITLYEGEINQQEFFSPGGADQEYYLGPDDFTTADADIACYVNDNLSDIYERQIKGLFFAAAGERVFYENTMTNGQVQISFGNDLYGAAPRPGDKLTFVYARTNGSRGNKTQLNQEAVCTDFPSVRGITTSAIAGGGDELPVSFYRLYGSNLYSAKEGAVRRDQYAAIALTYGGVIDAKFSGQAENMPDDVRAMNMVWYTLLTDPPFDDFQHQQFLRFFYGDGATSNNPGRSMWSMNFTRRDPIEIPIDIHLRVSCRLNSDLSLIKSEIEIAVRRFMLPKPGSLGFSIYRSDIFETVNNSFDDVDHLIVIEPAYDVLLTPIQFGTLRNLRIDMLFSDRARVND